MPGNKYLISDRSQLLSTKIDRLTKKIQGSLGSENLQTKEDYIFEAVKAIGELYESLTEPILTRRDIEEIHADDLPNASLYNNIWEKILDDLTVLFTELENTEDLTLANFNYITTEANRLVARLKIVDSKLGDYILYSLSPDKDVFFFKDSFNDLSKIDTGSPLLNASECNVNQAEGIATLPIQEDTNSLVVVKENPIINPNSNGIRGNNQETGANYNGNITVLLDNNPDTWFEYEKVVQATVDDKEPLILDMTMNIGESKIINFIRINPNNFGTKTVIEIEDISTSVDGENYTSIKDDIPIAGFSTQDEENIFELAPSTSKFAGQGLYTFTPRKVKYIHFIFKQSEPYVISTAMGKRLRYAIGLRDINIRQYVYESTGELISTNFESQREITKVAIEANQNPISISELAGIQYYVSPDDGGNWYELEPIGFEGPAGENAIPATLNFNNGDPNEIQTPIAVRSLRLKTLFTRNDDAFEEGSSSFKEKVITTSESHSVPRSSPFELELENPPVKESVSLIDPLFGSRGKPEIQYVLGHGRDQVDNRVFYLPFKNLPRPVKKIGNNATPLEEWHIEEVPASEWVHISVGGREWTQTTQPIDNYTFDSNNPQNYEFYNLNLNEGKLEFGDGVSTTTAPAADQPISIYFDKERLFPSNTNGTHKAKLDFATTSNKNTITIERYNPIKPFSETLPRRATKIDLKQQNITETTGIASALSAAGYDASAKDFVNGKEELTTSTSWSIDTENGKLYLGSQTPSDDIISITYRYQPVVTLKDNDWEWDRTNILRDSVRIKESAWETFRIEEFLPGVQNNTVLDLSKLAVVKKTLTLTPQISGADMSKDNSAHPFVKEVDFVDGVTELGGEYKKTTERIPGNLTSGTSVVSFTLKENISTLTTEHPIIFSDTVVFANEVVGSGSIISLGDYYVDRTGGVNHGTVYFYYSGLVNTNPGTVTYYYANNQYSENGLFSVNYKLGRIYTQRQINPTNDANYRIKARYQYSDYRISYNMARQVDLNDFEVNIAAQTVKIKDSEIAKRSLVPRSKINDVQDFYVVNYEYVDSTRNDIEQLKDYFTPTLKDFALRVRTKGKIVS